MNAQRVKVEQKRRETKERASERGRERHIDFFLQLNGMYKMCKKVLAPVVLTSQHHEKFKCKEHYLMSLYL